MGVLGWLRGGNDEIGWDDLVRRVVDALFEHSHYGPRGRRVFPEHVEIRIVVAGPTDVARGFAGDSEFDRAVAGQLANRCDCSPAELPARDYRVEQGDRNRVSVTEAAPRPWRLTVAGGDRDGEEVVLPLGQDSFRIGRGPWHGADRVAANDVVVCDQAAFVSRRAGRLWRVGNRLEVESLDQGDDLVVRRADGSVVRPARTASGRIALEAGDSLELQSGPSGEDPIVIGFRRD